MLTAPKNKEMQTALDEYYANKNVNTLHTILVKTCAFSSAEKIQSNIQLLIYDLFYNGDAPILLNTIDVLPTYVVKTILSQLVRIIIENDVNITKNYTFFND